MTQNRLLIYVAGPYSAPTPHEIEANVEAAIAAGHQIVDRGHLPMIPHLNHWFDLWHEREFGFGLAYDFYLDWDFELLAACDALLFLGPSPGANRELVKAAEWGIEIYESVNDIPRREMDCEHDK